VLRLVSRKHQLNPHFRLEILTNGVVLSGVLFGISACNGCGSDKPYTPFGVASALPAPQPPEPVASVAAAPNGAPAPSASSGFAVRKAELVPGAPRTWQGAGLSLIAPDARAFAQVLSADFDGDQKLDAIAWLVPEPGAKDAPPGELWFFPNGAAARKLTALPGFVPSGPECTLSATLGQTGPHSATLDATATCQAALIARSPTRALVVVAPNLERPVLLTLRAAAAAPSESLNFSVDSADQDQDGRDDVRVTLSVGALSSSEAASADLAWLDRAAGVSRAASEPVASLTQLASRIALHAHAKHGGHGPDRVGNVIRLLSSMCAEGGVPRVFDEDGTAFHCGDLTHVIDPLFGADVESALAQGDVLEAFAVLSRDGWYFNKLSSSQKKALERDALHAVTRLDADVAFVAHAQPTLSHVPHYSPLWFEADAGLLVRTDSGVTRVAADRSGEAALSAEAGAPSWPLEIVASSGARVTGTSHACDRSELLFNLSDGEHAVLPPLTTRLLAARPASCAGRGTGPNVTIAPFGFEAGALDALIAGSHLDTTPGAVKAPAGLPSLGTPRSPDGRMLVTATPLGLLVTGDRKELWQTDKLQAHANAGKFTDCVVANDARAVACLDGSRAVIFDRPKSSSAAHK
jgi:hypothetical protein